MIKSILISIAFSSTTLGVCAQDSPAGAEKTTEESPKPWKKGGVLGVNFAQTLLQNWQGGGQNAINGTVLLNAYANYAKEKWTWDNSLDGAYGLARIGSKGVLQKTDDRIEINSKVGHTTPVLYTYWAGLLSFRTQWDAGLDNSTSPVKLISDPFAPAYVMGGLGIDYKPENGFSAYISPATMKTTIVDNQRLANAGAYGVTAATYDATGKLLTPGENVRFEAGGFVKIQYVKDVLENVKLTTKADFFSNYIENPQNVDINWETLVAMKINKYLSTSLTTHLIYDDDIVFDVDRNKDGLTDGKGPRTQFKEVFSLGIQFQL